MNPPYFHRHQGSPARDAGRDMARGEQTGLGDWIDVATRRLGPGGTLSLIQRIERLPDVLGAIDQRLGAVQVLPILPRPGQPGGAVPVARPQGPAWGIPAAPAGGHASCSAAR